MIQEKKKHIWQQQLKSYVSKLESTRTPTTVAQGRDNYFQRLSREKLQVLFC